MTTWIPETPVSTDWLADQVTSYLLTEEGGRLLQEDGDKIILATTLASWAEGASPSTPWTEETPIITPWT